MIPVSKPYLPSLEKLNKKLMIPWETGILTHNGPLVQELELRLAKKWKVRNVIAVSNGTMAIQLAIRALELKGEIITTPFTWHATATAIKWEGCQIKFCDIELPSLCLSPEEVEANITKETVAIMPVNVYGNPPDFDKFEKISKKYGIPIIYDAAHASFTNFNGKSSFSNGTIAATSFHATKLMHTGEGGACITNDDKLADKLRSLRFFGFEGNGRIGEFGTNAKMTEIHAAIGLCVLDDIDDILYYRKTLSDRYTEKLNKINYIKVAKFENYLFESNNLYYPIIFDTESELIKIQKSLHDEEIQGRRYFYPSLNKISSFSTTSCPLSEDISRRVLCLPLHTDVDFITIDKIIEIMSELNKG